MRGLVASAVLSVLLSGAPGLAEPAQITSDLEAVRSRYELPSIAAAVVKDGIVVAEGAVGTRVAGMTIPVTLDDRYHLGSDTKAMTATLAVMLVEAGKLSWTSTVGDVLGKAIPGLRPSFAAVTLEQLLSHTSGIPSDNDEIVKLYTSPDAYDETPAGYRRKLIAAWGNAHDPKVPEGSPFQYSNLGYIVTGAMIEAAAGEPWERLITTRIFEPLKLATAGLGPQATFGKYDAPVGHAVGDDGSVAPRPWGVSADVPSVMGPAGMAHMSIRDFATWAAWNAGEGRRGPPLVAAESLKRLHRPIVTTPEIKNPKPGTPKTGGYALGWGVAKMDWTPRPVLTHNGSNSMNLATVLVDPEGDIAIVVATNFPGEKADAALIGLVQTLYTRFAPR